MHKWMHNLLCIPTLLPNPWTYSDVHVLEEDEERLSDQLKVPTR